MEQKNLVVPHVARSDLFYIDKISCFSFQPGVRWGSDPFTTADRNWGAPEEKNKQGLGTGEQTMLKSRVQPFQLRGKSIAQHGRTE